MRRKLLTDPRLQLPVVIDEAALRATLVKAPLSRRQFRVGAVSESDYVASLRIACDIERLAGCEAAA